MYNTFYERTRQLAFIQKFVLEKQFENDFSNCFQFFLTVTLMLRNEKPTSSILLNSLFFHMMTFIIFTYLKYV